MNQDMRTISPDAQEVLRRRVVAAVRDGMNQSEAARTFDVSRQSVNKWMARYHKGGLRLLKARKRGRKGGIQLAPIQAAQTVRMITDRCPDQLKMRFALWTRDAVRQLIEERFGVKLSVWTVGRYLKRWRLSPQKPLRKAFEKNPQAVRRWLESEYPAIRSQAKREKAQVHWGDEMGVRSDHQTGRSYGRMGQTPVIEGTGKRFSCNMISSITNRGQLRFMIFKEKFRAEVFLRFLKRLIRSVGHKVYLIVDRHPVHKSAKVRRWLEKHQKQIHMFFLPGYSPELNPDEMLNNDVKSNAVGRQRARTYEELIGNIRSYMWSTQKHPEIVQSYFHAASVQYAAV
jgi:transposase